ncbi:MAG: sulfotransferase [Candidatus Binatus sp.]|uniref:sulfotransferase family protein n=1 Tax=Candidatus Binatus sp. TaxID=2811406 RepID=UPI002719AC76|nr:sulfotransferase [Candidatus Binatus sp.]MDO8433807.1 sulfotransferase [Candidatus Binatus sp.]
MSELRREQRCLPEFFAVGPQRTGTTWLHRVLAGRVGLPSIKETDYFSKHHERGLDWYLEFFRQCPANLPLGEIDPNYFGIPEACDRIAALIPDCKIICSLRDPVERAYSSYRIMRRDAWTRVGFEETVAKNPVIRESSRYAYHLKNWWERFGRERVLVCMYEELEADPQAYLDRICTFIGIPRVVVQGSSLATERVNTVTHAPRSRRVAQNARNARDWMRLHRWHRAIDLLDKAGVWRYCFGRGEEFAPIDPAIEARLRERYRGEVEALEDLLGCDLSAWKGAQRDDESIGHASASAIGGRR